MLSSIQSFKMDVVKRLLQLASIGIEYDAQSSIISVLYNYRVFPSIDSYHLMTFPSLGIDFLCKQT